jgi:hypothetical protein
MAVDTPRLNLRSRRVLIPLLYRALAGSVLPDQALLTQRKLENCQAEGTELLKQLSELRSTVKISDDKLKQARHGAQQAGLDLSLHLERLPPQPRRWLGIFPARLSREQRAAAAEWRELEAISGQARNTASAIADGAKELHGRLVAVERRQAENRALRDKLGAELDRQLAADILSQLASAAESAQERAQESGEYRGIAAGAVDACLEQLEGVRRAKRGGLMAAVLHVLVRMLAAPGPEQSVQASRAALMAMSTVFEQHNDPIVRLLESLARWDAGKAVSLVEVGLLSSQQFSAAPFYRLYTLLRVLAGLGYDADELNELSAGASADSSSDSFLPTLIWLHELVRVQGAGAGHELEDVQTVVAASRSGDIVTRLIAANLLLQSGNLPELLTEALGEQLSPAVPRTADAAAPATEPLLTTLHALRPAAWPAISQLPWAAALACHLLLAARVNAPSWLYERWLQESYGWPKDDLYWWTLSTVNSDPALLRSMRRTGADMFTL